MSKTHTVESGLQRAIPSNGTIRRPQKEGPPVIDAMFAMANNNGRRRVA
jgi:hypothetical protein